MKLLLPTPEQATWADCEIGVLIHYDLFTYAKKGYNFRKHWGEPLSPKLFCPDRLDTDQWVSAAASMGAKYAVLVAKHCTGFCLWPTKSHEYSVRSSPWKDGKGDVVADFIASCEKYGVKPGLYYSSGCNHYRGIDGHKPVLKDTPALRESYNRLVIDQLTELWTNYGALFEIWFDGGCLPVENGGADIAALLHALQPKSCVFQGPENTASLLRWVGNERGFAPENCSSITGYSDKSADCGDTNGDVWCPAESDRPNREAPSIQGGWFWQPGEEKYILPAEELFQVYLNSVGHNSNMLLGMAIDPHGQFPAPDTKEFLSFGEMLRSVFGTPKAKAVISEGAYEYTVSMPAGEKSEYLVFGEKITEGERVTGFTVFADGKEIYRGTVISHKKILKLKAHSVTVRITSAKAAPRMRFVELY